MGMYTELVAGFDIRDATVATILEYMMDRSLPIPDLPDHPLFETERWSFMLVCGSYYFAGPTNSIIVADTMTKEWNVSIRSNLKNYDDEIEKFINWIQPYIVDPEPGIFFGYSRYEEYQNSLRMYYVGGEKSEDDL